jgi:hypothetical protein
MKELPDIDDVIRAIRWYRRHERHVESLMSSKSGADSGVFPPSGSDCLRPELWKAGHWRWLLIGEAA